MIIREAHIFFTIIIIVLWAHPSSSLIIFSYPISLSLLPLVYVFISLPPILEAIFALPASWQVDIVTDIYRPEMRIVDTIWIMDAIGDYFSRTMVLHLNLGKYCSEWAAIQAKFKRLLNASSQHTIQGLY